MALLSFLKIVILCVLLQTLMVESVRDPRIVGIEKYIRAESGPIEPVPDDGSGGCDCSCVNGTDGKDGKDGKSVVGPQGPPGQTGQQGLPGTNGRDGKDGKDGDQGVKGDQGVQGLQGPRGPPGVCDQAILDGINQRLTDLSKKLISAENGLLAKHNGLDKKVSAAVDFLTYSISAAEKEFENKASQLSASIKAVNESRIPGPRGPPGPQGNQGPEGQVGPKGSIGPKGLQGIQGPKGEQGVRGPRGESGISALKGCKHHELTQVETSRPTVEVYLPDLSPGHVMVGVECSSSVQGVTSRFSSAGTTTFKCICSRGSTIGWGNDDGDNAMTKTDTNKRFTHWGRRRVSSSRRRRYPGVLPKITCEMHYWECPAE